MPAFDCLKGSFQRLLSILLSISILHAVLSLAITESLSIEFLFRGVLILWCMSVCLRSFVTKASQVRGSADWDWASLWRVR